MKNVFLKIITGIMLVTILNTGYVLANAVASPETIERLKREELRKIIGNPRVLEYYSKEYYSKEDQETIQEMIKKDPETKKNLREIIKKKPEIIKEYSIKNQEAIQEMIQEVAITQKEDDKAIIKENRQTEKDTEERKAITTYVFISMTGILIILIGLYGLKYIKKNKK